MRCLLPAPALLLADGVCASPNKHNPDRVMQAILGQQPRHPPSPPKPYEHRVPEVASGTALLLQLGQT